MSQYYQCSGRCVTLNEFACTLGMFAGISTHAYRLESSARNRGASDVVLFHISEQV
jgi:hypothetical protein